MTATRTAKETISLISKQQLCTCSTLALFNISFPLLLQRETSSLHVLWKKCCMCWQKILFLVFLFSFFFQCRSFFTLLTARISYFLTAATKCSCCPCYEIRLLCFLSLALALCRSLSRWVSLACRVLSRFLCLSLSLNSKSEDMTINLSLILETTRI